MTRHAVRAKRQRFRARGIARLLCGSSVVLAAATAVAAGSVSVASARVRGPVATAAGSDCPGVSGPRNPSNPLGLATAPGADPLNGAQFFVDGPSHGAAAGQIARLLGIDANVPVGQYLPAFKDNVSWQSFLTDTVDKKLPTVSKTNQTDIQLLEKIASEPEAQRISTASSDKGFSPRQPGRDRRVHEQVVLRQLHRGSRNGPGHQHLLDAPGPRRLLDDRADPEVHAVVRAARQRDRLRHRRPCGRLPAGTRRRRLIGLHGQQGLAPGLGEDAQVRGRSVCDAPPRGRLRRGGLLGLEHPAVRGQDAQSGRHKQDPGVLHKRHPPAVDLPRDHSTARRSHT